VNEGSGNSQQAYYSIGSDLLCLPYLMQNNLPLFPKLKHILKGKIVDYMQWTAGKNATSKA
jgi:hypothetical protein